MTAPTTSPNPKRTPSGAAVAGAVPRPTFYPRQIVIMATDAQADYIAELAEARNVSKSEIGRMLIDAGIAAGHRASDR
jgi:hypothetical protein